MIMNFAIVYVAGMTPYYQLETLKKFKEGNVKLLVTTSVGEEGIDIADCNLTIRYNHVGNEVTTVQTRGKWQLLHFF
jgi:ERCC4-related helicase